MATSTRERTAHLVTITIDTDGPTGNQTATVTATDGHPFWSPELHLWVDAATLQPGQLLQTAAGTWVQATAITHHTAVQRVHNLTIHDIHTYYVAIEGSSVLVHNCGGALSRAYNGAKRLVNVPRAWLNNRALARALDGTPPEPNATVRDLSDFKPGNRQRPEKLVNANARSDEDLLNSVFAPGDNQFIATNPSMPSTILQGNHRVYQLLRRAADPENKKITYDTRIFINRGDW